MSADEPNLENVPKKHRRAFWARARTTLHTLGFGVVLVLAAPKWPYVLAGLPLLLLGIAIRVYALGYLRKDETLCMAGPYAFIRNPLYLGNLFILAGVIVGGNSPYLTLFGLAQAVVVYVFTVRSEEAFLRARFGEGYREYCRRVPRLIPYRGRRVARSGHRFSWALVRHNNAGEWSFWLGVLFAVLVAKSFLGPLAGLWPYTGGGPPLTWGLCW